MSNLRNGFGRKEREQRLVVKPEIEIVSGLKEGDVVVTSGAYLLNSEYIFKDGSNPVAGNDMKNM